MDFACIVCETVFKRYSTIQTRCRECTAIKLQGKAPKPRTPLKRSQKPIKQRGKAAKQWDIFRDKVARPYLDTKYGMQCTDCGVYPPKKEYGTYYRHDVDHVVGKGSHPELKFDVTNLAYRCRNCHIAKTGVPQWSGGPVIDLQIFCDTGNCMFSTSSIEEFDAHVCDAHAADRSSA